MHTDNLEVINSFDEQSLPDLDTVVLAALELFAKEQLPILDVSMYKRPLVVGSGNAEETGRIIFEKSDALFASESTYKEKLKHIESIDGVVLVSASGEKHAPIIAECSATYGKHVTLITNAVNSSASNELDDSHKYDEYVYPKNREPYTYNTSTYMGMILGHTEENPEKIHSYISSTIETLQYPDLSRYDKVYIIVPPKFAGIIRMLQIKFIELFGRRIARDVVTSEYVKHATTVVPSDELFISFGEENTVWGEDENRLFVPLPADADYGAMMAIAYYVIGKIQKAHPPYFKENIGSYIEKASSVFNHQLHVIVE